MWSTDEAGMGDIRGGGRSRGGRGVRGGRGGSGFYGHGPDHAFHEGRIRRGEVRDLLLAALLEGPANGYELMSRLEQRTGGRWRPSPGSVYPLLQLFVDQGLVRAIDQDGRKVFELTDDGRAQADQSRLHQFADGDPFGSQRMKLRDEVHQLHGAARQVGMAGRTEQMDRAVEIIKGARQALYQLLAEQ
jgi:DNA-binding PadR family transcriptional regulator